MIALILSCTLALALDQTDPTKGEVPLPAAPGWNARLVLDRGDIGIWTVRSFPVFNTYATPEILGLSDDGRCHVLVAYSGKWTPTDVVHDHKWLGGIAFDDVDPRLDGSEAYVGGEKGNLYQIAFYPYGTVDCRLIAQLPGLEIHSIVSRPVDGRKELLVFTRPGALYRGTPNFDDGGFDVRFVEELPGRVRNAVILPGPGSATIATVSRSGHLRTLSVDGMWTTIHEDSSGMGRLTLKWDHQSAKSIVMYSTLDDGRILRHERVNNDWTTETIYQGPQGPRGVVSGVFTEDRSEESIVIFGYSGKVELLVRTPGGWTSTTIFEDRDRGHSLTTIEIDGRNATTEIVGSGYGGRIFLLSRPPGYGVEKTAPQQPGTNRVRDAAPR